MTHEVSPYPDGCKIKADDPRSYCQCFAACAPGPVPPFQFVLNVPSGQAAGWGHIEGRWILPRIVVGPSTCEWEFSDITGPFPREFEVIKTASGGSPSVDWALRIQEHETPFCHVVRQTLSPADEICCQALDYSDTLWSPSCVDVPPQLLGISLWPVPWDFTAADL